MPKKTLYCTIRKDLAGNGNLISVGNQYVIFEATTPIQYKWVGDDIFMIKHKGKWCEAESIDFDFN